MNIFKYQLKKQWNGRQRNINGIQIVFTRHSLVHTYKMNIIWDSLSKNVGLFVAFFLYRFSCLTVVAMVTVTSFPTYSIFDFVRCFWAKHKFWLHKTEFHDANSFKFPWNLSFKPFKKTKEIQMHVANFHFVRERKKNIKNSNAKLT